jgi:phosphoglycerate dehydrogenase-like enzyme
VEALQDGAYKRLAGAGLDTFSHEPIELNHPLLKMNNVIFTPHVALAVSMITARNITEFLRKKTAKRKNLFNHQLKRFFY